MLSKLTTLTLKKMVTIQEVEEREQELNETEVQAKQILKRELPQRRYGSGVTREQQQQVYAQRSGARDVLGQIKEQRRELQDIRNQIAEAQRQERERQEAERRNQEIEQAQKLIERGKGNLLRQGTPSQRNIYNKYIKGQPTEPVYQKRITQLPQEVVGAEKTTITPLPQNVLGDTTYRETRFVLPQKVLGGKKSPIPEPTITVQDIDFPQRTIVYNPEIIETTEVREPIKYKSAIADFERIFIDQPFERYATFQEDVKRRNPEVGGIYGSPEVTRLAKGLIQYPIYGAKQIEIYARNKEARAEFKKASKIQQAQEVLDITGSGLVAGSIVYSSYKYLVKPVRLKNIPVGEEVNLADTKIADIKIGSRLRTISQFRVIGITPGEAGLEVTRIRAIRSGVITESQLRRIQAQPVEDILTRFPEAQFRNLKPIRVTESITQPFLVKRGRVQGQPAVFSFRLNQNVVERELRSVTSKRLSILAGESYQPRSIRTLSRQRLELTDIQRVALEKIETIPTRGNIKIKRTFPKETELQTGGILIEDIYKIKFKGGKRVLEEIPYGRRTTRAETTAIQKEIAKIETSKEFGLKEIGFLSERIGVIDTTFPRIRSPRKALEIKGRVERREFEFPGDEPLGLFQTRGGRTRSSQAYLKKLYAQSDLNQKAIQKAIGSVTLRNQFKTPSPKISEPNLRTESIYAGTGLYERTESVEAVRITSLRYSAQLPKINLDTRNMEVLKAESKFNIKEIEKQLTKVQQKEITKEITKQLPKSISKEILKEVTKQQEKQLTKQITKQAQKEISKSPPFRPPRITPQPKRTRPPIIIPGLTGKEKRTRRNVGYKPFVIIDKKKVYLNQLLPKGLALREAEIEAKKSLRATFGVKETKIKVNIPDIDYKPSSKLFRDYRIKEGKRIPLKDTYIQRLTKRLSFGGEKTEIQRARRRSKR